MAYTQRVAIVGGGIASFVAGIEQHALFRFYENILPILKRLGVDDNFTGASDTPFSLRRSVSPGLQGGQAVL